MPQKREEGKRQYEKKDTPLDEDIKRDDKFKNFKNALSKEIHKRKEKRGLSIKETIEETVTEEGVKAGNVFRRRLLGG